MHALNMHSYAFFLTFCIYLTLIVYLDLQSLGKDDPLSLYPSCYINHVEYDNFAGNILYLSSLFSGVLNKCCQIDRNHKVALSH